MSYKIERLTLWLGIYLSGVNACLAGESHEFDPPVPKITVKFIPSDIFLLFYGNCIPFLWPLRQITTNLIAKNSFDCHSSADQSLNSDFSQTDLPLQSSTQSPLIFQLPMAVSILACGCHSVHFIFWHLCLRTPLSNLPALLPQKSLTGLLSCTQLSQDIPLASES